MRTTRLQPDRRRAAGSGQGRRAIGSAGVTPHAIETSPAATPLRPRRASRRRAPACAAYVLNVKHRRMIRTRGRRSTRVGCAPPGFRRFRRGVFPRLDPGVEGRTSVHVSSPAASAPEGPAHTATSQSPKPTSPDHHPTRGDRNAPYLTERHWWPPLGRSHGRQRAVFMTATGQFLLALDKRVRKTSDGVMVRTHPPGPSHGVEAGAPFSDHHQHTQ